MEVKGNKDFIDAAFLVKLIYYFYALFIYSFTRSFPSVLHYNFCIFIDILMQFIFSFSD